MTVHLNKSESPLMTLAGLSLFLKVYDPGFASKTSKALPRAVWSKGILSFHLTPDWQSIMIRRGREGGSQAPRGLLAGEAV